MSDRYVIVGGVAAGFTAGIHAARDRCRALLVERFSPGSSAGDGATAAPAAIRCLRTGRWHA